MKLLTTAATLGTSLVLIAVPAIAGAAGKSDQTHGKAGQHGNHCGRGHAKHVKGQGGLKLGKTCVKAKHGVQDPSAAGSAPGNSSQAHSKLHGRSAQDGTNPTTSPADATEAPDAAEAPETDATEAPDAAEAPETDATDAPDAAGAPAPAATD